MEKQQKIYLNIIRKQRQKVIENEEIFNKKLSKIDLKYENNRKKCLKQVKSTEDRSKVRKNCRKIHKN